MPSSCEVTITSERIKKVKPQAGYVQRSVSLIVSCECCGIREPVNRKGYADTPIFQARQEVFNIVAARCLKLTDTQRTNMPSGWVPEIVFSSSLVKE